MIEMQPIGGSSWRDRNGTLLSAAIHAIVLTAVVGVLHGPTKLAPYKLPGTSNGVRLLTYYAPGSTQMATNEIPTKVVEKHRLTPTVHAAIETPKPDSATALNSDRGVASSGQSGLGDGNITIALEKYFPYPKPSLSSLPQGTVGDVILKAVIDEHGKITELTLLEGLGPEIDDQVIQTVNQWIYTPATKDGVPVPSVEELHFHYERRG